MHVMLEKQLTRLRCALLNLTNADQLCFATKFTTVQTETFRKFWKEMRMMDFSSMFIKKYFVFLTTL